MSEMKKLGILLLVFAVIFSLGACAKENVTTEKVTEEKEVSEKEEVQNEKIENEEIKQEEMVSGHSEFYIEGYTVEDVIRYFNEIVLATEYSTGDGNVSLVQRWEETIYYSIEGEARASDLVILEDLFEQLNKIEGFPKIVKASEETGVNLCFYFGGREAFDERFVEFLQGEYADGANRYWYDTDMNNIYEGDIGYCTDMPDEVRKSVLLEEVMNCLGVGDSISREDSIVYQYGSEVEELSDMDWLIVKLMYHPQMRCGMDASQCEAVIRTLYY